MKVVIVGVGSVPMSKVKEALAEMGHNDIVLVEPKDVKEINLKDLDIPQSLKPSLVKTLDMKKYEELVSEEDTYEKRQKKMRNNHYKHMKHRL